MRQRLFAFLAGVMIVLLMAPSASSAQAKPPHCTSDRWPTEEYALALSGGGYRAMLFHLGSLKRLNELGLLPCARSVSSVSGGSIIAGLLAIRWKQLQFDEGTGIATNFDKLISEPILNFSNTTVIDQTWSSVLRAYRKGPEILKGAYRQLVGSGNLAALPVKPSFHFNAVNYGTRAIWTFARERMGDDILGYIENPNVDIATAIAGSSAFPPFLSPLKIEPGDVSWVDGLQTRSYADKIANARKQILLTDGGVIDNLGLTSIENKTVVFASDAGMPPVLFSAPVSWLDQVEHVVDIAQQHLRRNQVNELLEEFKRRFPNGIYWTIKQLPTHKPDVLTPEKYLNTEREKLSADLLTLATFPTQLSKVEPCIAKRLVNMGYLSADFALPYSNALWSSKYEGRYWAYQPDGLMMWKLSSTLPFPSVGLGSNTGGKC